MKSSVASETELWKNNLVENDWCNIGPKYKVDKFKLPTPQPGVPQPKWVHNKRKFLEALSFQERNILLMGDPFLEFDPCTYVLVYSYPNQVQNYPAIQQAFPHIVQQPQSPGASSWSSNFEFSNPSSFTPKSSPATPWSRTVTLSNSSPSPSTTPSTSKSKFFSVPKAMDQPRSKAWIRRNLLKQTNQSGSKAPP